MPNINIGKTKKLLIVYLSKIVISTLVIFAGLISIVSLIYVKCDISIDTLPVVSIVIATISSYLISKISVSGIKNNKVAMCLISIAPVMIFSIINFILSPYGTILFIVKLLMIVVASIVASIGKNKIKV